MTFTAAQRQRWRQLWARPHHRNQTDRLTLAIDRRAALPSEALAHGLGELLAFRHLVRHRYDDDLDPELVRRRLEGVLELWPRWLRDLDLFDRWLAELRELSWPEGGASWMKACKVRPALVACLGLPTGWLPAEMFTRCAPRPADPGPDSAP